MCVREPAAQYSFSIPEKCIVAGVFLLPFDNLLVDVGVLVPPSLAACLVGVTTAVLNKLLRGGPLVVRGSLPNKCLLLFFGVALFTSAVGVYKLQALGVVHLQGGVLRSSSFRWIVLTVKLGFFLVVYFLLAAYGARKKFLVACFNAVLLSSLIVCVYGFYQWVGSPRGWPFMLYSRDPTGGGVRTSLTYAGDIPRMQSFAQEPKGLADFLWVAIIVGIFARHSASILWNHRRLKDLILVSSIVALVLTFSRSGWAVSLLTLPIVVLSLGKLGKSIRRIGSVVLISVCLVLAAGVAASVKKGSTGMGVLSDRAMSSTEMLREDYQPFINIMCALELLRRNYLCGIGLGNFAFYLKDSHPEIKSVYSLHNMYLSVWLETGIVGLLTMVSFIVSSLRLAYVRLNGSGDPFARWSLATSLSLALGVALSSVYGGGPSFLYFLLFGLLSGASHSVGEQEAIGVAQGSCDALPA
jgi:O-antigen ligase